MVRRYEPADLPQVLGLLRASLGETDRLRRTTEGFAWKHLNNPFGTSIMLVAEDSEGVVGFRAFMRWLLGTADGGLLRCVRAVDTATHPRAQRQGIFRRLTMEALEIASGEGVDLVFNTPNPRSKAGYLTMGWTQVGQIGVMARPRLMGLVGRREDLPSVPGWEPWSEHLASDRAPLGLRTPRTPEYLNWRFGQHPSAGYRVVGDSGGAVVLRPSHRRSRQELVVSDMFGDECARAIRYAARVTDAAYLVAWFSPGSPERRQAVSAGLIPLPGVTSLTLVARPLHPDIAWAARGLAQWDLALSDLELL